LKRDVERFLKFLSLFPKNLGVISHANADPDALASSLVVCSIVKKMTGYHPSVIFPEGISRVSRKILSYTEVSLEFYEEMKRSIKALIIVDTATLNQFGPLCNKVKEFKGRAFLIDHHIPDSDLIGLCYDSILKEEVATSVIVYNISKELGVQLSTNELFLVLTGILFDTRRFMIASPTALKVVSEILESGVSYSAAIESLQQEMDVSERIARLKAAGRIKLYKLDKWLVATTKVSSFEASAARALMNLGADVVFVASDKDDFVRISARCTRSFYEEAGISVGQHILRKVAEAFSGSGGGHHLAGGATVVGDIDAILEKCVELLSNITHLSIKRIKID